MWTDSHCHLPYEGIDDTAVADARAAGVTRMVTIGTDARRSTAAIAVARAHDGVWATVGLHPHDAMEGLDGIEELLDRTDPVVVGVGECGLDYYYDHSPRAIQREVFAAQVALAAAHDLALVIHTRDAWDDTWDVLQSVGVPARTVVHCFSGGAAEARRALNLGTWISFSGIVSFKNGGDVREAAALCPLDRLLVETDAPFLAPVPHRGQANRPAWVPVVGAAVAAARGVATEVIRQASWDNASAVFGLDAGPA